MIDSQFSPNWQGKNGQYGEENIYVCREISAEGFLCLFPGDLKSKKRVNVIHFFLNECHFKI